MVSISDSEHLAQADHLRLAEFIEQVVGIQLPAHKRSLIETRLRKRLRATQINHFHEYLDYVLNGDTQEQVMLIDALTTNKTDFFREANHFEYLYEYLDRLLNQSNQNRLHPYRFWSAGCSTGEEPYTLAMFLETLKINHPAFDYQIEATDISVSVLQTAQQAIYPHHLAEPIPMAYRKRFLLRKKTASLDLVKVAPELRQHIHFSEFNLVTGNFDAMGGFDGIFCRNVMIYFSQAQRQLIIENFTRLLTQNGFFFVGHSEGVSARQFGLEQKIPTVYQKIST
ncbi:CheR family methyltransferase [Celerinatantimonas sp. YJH-8]|uniref:CheR family methyltransferase n=1 Tax=Celerinatantimonas sp. YJH-8 TaxID=3228714 RepID=UPI0038BF6150